MTIPNVLASRYASDEMVAIWSPEAKIVAERRLWLAVLRAQIELGTEGAAVPSSVLADYERVLDGEPSRRALAVIAAETVDRLNLTVTEGLAVYTPITKRYISP